MVSIPLHSINHTIIRCCVQHSTFFIAFILMLHVSINVQHHQVFSTNPQNQGKKLLFGRSLQYYNIYIYLFIYLVQQSCTTDNVSCNWYDNMTDIN